MKKLIVLTLLTATFLSFAHEGGHGEINESGKFGGITAPVVDNKEANLIDKAKVQYKAELVRSESGKLSLYMFDEKMSLIGLAPFDNEGVVKLEVKKKGKFTYVGEIKITKNGNHFTGQLPAIDYKPFNLDIYLMKAKQKLFVGFANLD